MPHVNNYIPQQVFHGLRCRASTRVSRVATRVFPILHVCSRCLLCGYTLPVHVYWHVSPLLLHVIPVRASELAARPASLLSPVSWRVTNHFHKTHSLFPRGTFLAPRRRGVNTLKRKILQASKRYFVSHWSHSTVGHYFHCWSHNFANFRISTIMLVIG
jgi:hypothetical protein